MRVRAYQIIDLPLATAYPTTNPSFSGSAGSMSHLAKPMMLAVP